MSSASSRRSGNIVSVARVPSMTDCTVVLTAAEVPAACLEYPCVMARQPDGRASLLAVTGLQDGAGKIADAFLESRLAGGWRHTYGVLDARFDSRYVLDLLYPPAT